MANNTRLKTLSDKRDEMLSQMSIFSTQMTNMHTHFSYLESLSSPPPSHSIAHTPSASFLKLDVPRFDGTDPVEADHKLAKRFYGPFKVLERIGPVAYKIELPPQSKIHNHHEGPVPLSIDNLPLEYVENRPLVTPLAVLDFKTVPVDGVPTRFALVQCNGLSLDDTSWEKWHELKSLYDLEDKVLVEGDGIVMQDPMDEGVRPKRLVKRPVGWSDFIHH
ncbi:hypothetical protein V8G54_035620 [Vigna mungo]|uniref:Tf2-1-like SH3-like domain-containing protein n=1 Tax=Vigna mungo TaxID=3915 RepID=A0AAQ3MF98_VIGMU